MKITELEKKQTEWHLPGYQFCGPGTRVYTRLLRGDQGINELDKACRKHDIEYFKYAGDNKGLREADNKLRRAAKKIGGVCPFFVDKVFFFKNIGESLGLWTPAGFARGLGTGGLSEREQRQFGKKLYKKYIENKKDVDMTKYV